MSHRINAIAPWFGSKRTLAPRIVEALGPHRAYWEPFCGSMAVLLAKEPATMETVNDLHGDLINLARVLQIEHLAAGLYNRLARTLVSEALFKTEAALWKEGGHQPASDQPDPDRAYRFFVCSWMGMNGVAGTQSFNQGFAARYTQNGGAPATRFVAAVESIPDWHHRLRLVTILNKDAFELLGKVEDADGVAIYLDPPYLTKGAKYVHDFARADHARLAEAVRRFRRTRVVVSYYDHPLVRELYSGWRVIDCATTKAMVAGGKRDQRGRTEAPEILLVNQEMNGGLFQ